MNINRKVLSMALGGAALPLGLAVADESLPLPKPLSSVGRISDASPSVRATTVSSQRPMMQVNQRASQRLPAPNSNQTVFRNASYSAHESGYEDMMVMDDSSYIPDESGSMGCASGACDSYGCDSPSGRIMGCGLGNMLGWGEVEALLWWGPTTETPPLVATGDQSQPATNVVLGGPDLGLGGELLPGLRANVGFWLDDCQSIGMGGRAFGLFSPESTHTFSSNGSTTLGVPYLDATQGIQSAYLVAFDTNGAGVDTGSISVESDTNLIVAEAYGRFLLTKSGTSRADLIGGYTFVRLDDSLNVHTISVDGITNPTVNGTVEETLDQFSTKNTFHGGHIGFTTDMTQGRWTFSTLSKVSIGNVNQQTTVLGQSVDTPPPNVGNPVTRNTGLLALDSNIGGQQRDVFTFIPEAGAKLRYNLTPQLKISVGYTFVFFPDLALAGSLIDPVLDLNRPQVIPTPQPFFEHDSYYLHGLDLGLSYNY